MQLLSVFELYYDQKSIDSEQNQVIVDEQVEE